MAATFLGVAANCAACGTHDGKLPQRYINSIQMEPTDASTVYVTLGGYGRRWIPPGALADDVSKVGAGHVFVSHDAGNTFPTSAATCLTHPRTGR